MFGGKLLGNQKTIETPTLKIWGETLIFGKTILYIPNLSSIESGEIRRPIWLYTILLAIPIFLFYLLVVNQLYYYDYYYESPFSISRVIYALAISCAIVFSQRSKNNSSLITNLITIAILTVPTTLVLYGLEIAIPFTFGFSHTVKSQIASALVVAYIIVRKTGKRYGLRLGSNSGEVNYLVSPDVQFIDEIAGVLYNVLNGVAHESYYIVNFDQRKITEITEVTLTNSVGVFGDNTGKATVNKFVSKDVDDEELPL